jgi:Beta-ketoacyl synthase, C-terminal domain/Beta-ketoacyl synthase, N-terminal domain
MVAGRRMFREFTRGGDDGRAASRGGLPAGRRPVLAALLDDGACRLGRDDDLTGGITARHVLAAETAVAALHDVPQAARSLPVERIGVFIADIPEPGTADVGDWVYQQLRLITAADGAVPAEVLPRQDTGSLLTSGLLAGGEGIARPTGGTFKELVLGPVNGAHANSVNGTSVNGAVPGLHCSLRAVTAACEALNSGAFDVVLAGGVARSSEVWRHGATAPVRSARHVRVYDARPTGALPGEGCGVVALMRAADARAAQVPGYAEIAGWHYADHPVGQSAVLPEAYLRAGIDPADIQFVEGHGAATADDDLAELSALLELLGSRAGAGQRCALGSVAAIIGDTKAAAGVAALLKTACAMTADIIPPSTGCVHPNRLLRGKGAPFRLPTVPEQWPQTSVQLAAVNTLGTAPHPDAPRSGPVHVVLRRDRDPAHRPGRRRKPVLLAAAPVG